MKRTISFALSLLLLCALLAGCGDAAPGDTAPADAPVHGLRIVTTIFPLYDWTRCILGEQADGTELTLLQDQGVDLHSYQPTVEDIVKLSDCDLFLYVGGESDAWVGDALAELGNEDMLALNLLELLGDRVREEELVEGMEDEHEHEDEHDHEDADGHEHEHGEEAEYDEHVWLSLRNAALLCEAIADALARLDPDGAEQYRANAAAYTEKLKALDARYQSAVDAAAVKTLLFADRFPFRYLTEDYGLDYYAAFAGCSAETEASFETVVFLANKADELGLRAICQIESADGSLARTVRDNTAGKDQQILTLDSLQSVTAGDLAQGVSYLGLMEQNLAVLQEALRQEVGR